MRRRRFLVGTAATVAWGLATSASQAQTQAQSAGKPKPATRTSGTQVQRPPTAPRFPEAPSRGVPATPSGLDWSRLGAIYEVNIRQHSAQGNLRAVEADLPRLRSLGTGIVWLMPLQPIGELHRKGTLGSYYAIRDYTAVNPEFGTLDDVRRLVDSAHRLGMKVILDWVANHTAWDHPWVMAHPQWYRRSEDGQILAARADPSKPDEGEVWEDVAWLDYRQPEMAVAMIQAMRFWRTEVGMDGFRCDVAGAPPSRFWSLARQVLDRDGPLIMLAESDTPELHAAGFDITYDWKLQRVLQGMAQGQADATALRDWWVQRVQRYPVGSIGLNFLTNHDINSWEGSDEELYGSPAAAQAMAVLAATLPGVPLLYSGHETFLRRRLAFFERDPIDWSARPLEAFYSGLMRARIEQPALVAPLMLDGLEWLPENNPRVVTFVRKGLPGQRIRISVNLSDQPQTTAGKLQLPPWGWKIGAPAPATGVRSTPRAEKKPARPKAPAAKPKAASTAAKTR